VALLALLALLGCKRTDEASGPPGKAHADGAERGDCYGNGTCNAGLTCMSGLCVRPPGVDCDAIVAHLGGLLLDPYTARDVRDRWVAGTTADCLDARLTKADGDCLLAAAHRNVLSRCARAVGIGDCAVIVPHVRSLPGNDPDLKTDADRIADRCRNEVPSKTFESCALSARTVSDLSRCTW